ncbi:MAG: DUF4234 domain-containing protein [Nocardioidaceae bacterium]
MTDQNPEQPPPYPTYPGGDPQQGYPPPPSSPQQMQPYGQPMPGQLGPIGQVRGTGMAILLSIVTLGIYSWYWYFKTHEEMKRHTGAGLGGGVALILAIFVGIVMPYITSSEVGAMYERSGREAPVSGATGLWYFPGILILVGPIIWFVKTNGAINRYWESLGAQR